MAKDLRQNKMQESIHNQENGNFSKEGFSNKGGAPVRNFRKRLLFMTLFASSTAAMSLLMISACTNQAKAERPNIVEKDTAPKAGVLAKIGNQEITAEELTSKIKSELFELQEREYQLKLDQLRAKMVEVLIGEEAKKAKMSLDDYVQKKVAGGDIKISDKEYKEFIQEKHIPVEKIDAQVKVNIENYLKTMKKQDLVSNYLGKLTKNAPVEFYMKKPKLILDVEPGDAPSFGKNSAPVTIVEYSDFQCPFCSQAADVMTELKKKYGPNKIRFAFKQFPLPMHSQARPTAEASMCVNEQGSDKFWKFHDLAFKNQDKLDKASLEKYAQSAGADMKKFNECVSSNKYADYVQKDMEGGNKLGVRGTPTFFVNQQQVRGGAPSVKLLSELIDESLASSSAKN